MEQVQLTKLIYSRNELRNMNLSNFKINQLVKNGQLTKLTNQYYEYKFYNGIENDLFYTKVYSNEGIVCLLSAAFYYQLTTYIPDHIDIAISRKGNVSKLIDWPPIHVYYFSDQRYPIGVQTVIEEENEFKIYDIEKTVVDIIYYRETVGIEEMKEILMNYLQRDDCNINQLLTYAKRLKCEGVLKNYLEVL